jgi:hypothetical protein
MHPVNLLSGNAPWCVLLYYFTLLSPDRGESAASQQEQSWKLLEAPIIYYIYCTVYIIYIFTPKGCHTACFIQEELPGGWQILKLNCLHMWVKHGHVDVQTNMHSLHLLSLFLGISFRDPIRMLVNPLSGDAPRRALLYYFTPEDFTRQGESSVLPNSMG